MYDFNEKLYFQFPWLNGSSEVLFQKMGIPPQTLEKFSIIDIVRNLFASFPDIKFRIITFFENISSSEERFLTPTDDIQNLAMYPVLQIIISMLGNRIFANALANAYAKHCKRELAQFDAKHVFPDKILQKICQNVGIQCFLGKTFIEKNQYPFEMKFPSYLQVATKMKDEAWKLINRRIINGVVYLIRPDVVMLLREFVRMKVQPDFSQMDSSLSQELETIPEIVEILGFVEEIMKTNASRFNSSSILEGEKINFEYFPPCMKVILHRSSQGENLSHNERLAICFYYLNTNHSIEETVDIFRVSPDFDEGIARYQVEFAAGKGGKGKKYAMYNCAKLKSLHLCQKDHSIYGDTLCMKGIKKKNGEIANIQNPIKDYVFWKKVQLNRIHRSQIDVNDNTSEINPSN